MEQAPTANADSATPAVSGVDSLQTCRILLPPWYFSLFFFLCGPAR